MSAITMQIIATIMLVGFFASIVIFLLISVIIAIRLINKDRNN